MSIKDLQLPAEPKYPQKKFGGEYVTQDYKDIKEYLLFLRNMLVHCRPDLTNPKDLMEIRKELQDYLTADTEIRLPKLTFPYPNLLLHLLTMLVGGKEFTDAFKEDAKIDLTLMKTMVQE
uniref:Uncharacterized protein n=1 Tax=Ciona savignyi TaxID=51511 RepID=H2YZ52_CIOSA